MSRTIHVAVNIDWCLRKSDKALARMFVRPGPGEIRAKLLELRALGFEVIPNCNDFDDRGFCRGHETVAAP